MYWAESPQNRRQRPTHHQSAIQSAFAIRMIRSPLGPVSWDRVMGTDRRANHECRQCLRFWKGPSVPRERVQQRMDEHIVGVPIPTITEDTVEESKMVPQEQFSERICERVVDVPVPQVDAMKLLSCRSARCPTTCM